MVVVPAGAFDMGSSTEYENPMHRVTFAKPFAIGRYEVTFDEWDRCVEDKDCKAQPDDREWGRGDRPVINVSWRRCEGLHKMAFAEDRANLPAPLRSRVGICRAGGDDHGVLVGSGCRLPPGELPGMQYGLRPANISGGFL